MALKEEHTKEGDNMDNKTYRFGNDGIYISTVAENDFFVPWSVIKRTEEITLEARKRVDKLPWGLRHILKKLMKNLSIRLSTINTIIETNAMVNAMSGRIVWKDVEYEEFTNTKT